MGMDITINFVCEDGTVIAEDIFPGSNAEWFRKMAGRGYDVAYDYLPIEYGNSIPATVKIDTEDEKYEYCFDFRYIKASDFLKWYDDYKPDLDAGWVHKYDAWQWRIRKIPPELAYKCLGEDMIVEDFEFITFEKEYDNSKWLRDKILTVENKYDLNKVWIVYYFDN